MVNEAERKGEKSPMLQFFEIQKEVWVKGFHINTGRKYDLRVIRFMFDASMKIMTDLENFEVNVKMLHNMPAIVSQFLVPKIQDFAKFSVALTVIIEFSKINENIGQVAAVSMSLLNFSGYNFHKADLRGVNIPGADLEGGNFGRANFSGADLRRVNFRNANLNWVNIHKANCEDMIFGERAPISHQNAISYEFTTWNAVAFNSLGN